MGTQSSRQNYRSELMHRRELAIIKRKGVVARLQNLVARVQNREISHAKYLEETSKKINGRTLGEWVEYYEAYISECESRLEKENKQVKSKQVIKNFAMTFVIFGLIALVSMTGPTLTGYAIKGFEILTDQGYTGQVNMQFSKSQTYIWTPENQGILESLALTGSIKGDGKVKVYLGDLLVFDSSSIKSDIENSKSLITGNAIEDGSSEFSEKTIYEEEDESEPEKKEESVSETPIEKEENAEDSQENQGSNDDEKIDQVTEPEKNPEENDDSHTVEKTEIVPEKEIEETIPISDIITIFKEQCVDTCNLEKYKLSERSYKIIIEVDNAELNLETIQYTLTNQINKNETDPLVLLEQGKAYINQPVQWTQTIEFAENADIEIELPQGAFNISVSQENEIEEESTVEAKKIKINKEGKIERDNFLENKENIISLKLSPEGSQAQVTYFTAAPRAEEKEEGKIKTVRISSPDEIHYKEVTIFAELNESFQIRDKDSIKIYWVENDTYLPIDSIEDRNNNTVYDYIQWIAPHLSNQTFQIIVITKAEHLDSERKFVSDIYAQVKEKDNIWSETIPATHYVRVTFERNLTNQNDITIYPKTISGNPSIEVYEKEGNVLIARFDQIVDNEYNQVFLTGLESTSQDTFDLRITDGNVEFDHIIDPILSAGTREGILVYGEGTVQNPRYRLWNGSAWSSELSANSVGGTIERVVVRGAPTRDEYFLVTSDSGDDINMQINGTLGGSSCWHNGASCGSVLELTALSTTANINKVDVSYEKVSGDALVVYANSTGAPWFTTWNGSTLSTLLPINHTSVSPLGALPLTGTIETTLLTSDPNSDEISLILSDTNDDAAIVVWNGTAWNCQSSVISINLGTTDVQKVDGEYQELSSELFVVSITSGTTINVTRKSQGSCTFTSTPLTVLNAVWMDIAAQKGSNRIMYVGSTGGTTDDMSARIWNGTAWQTESAEETSIYAAAAAPNNMFSAAFAGQKHGIVPYSDVVVNTVVDWLFWNQTSNSWTVPATDFTPTPSFAGPADSNILAYSFIDENKTFAFFRDINATAGGFQRLWAKIYDAETHTWSNTEGSTFLENNTASSGFQSFDFAWKLNYQSQSDTTLPVSTLIAPVNGTNTTLASHTFNATFTDDTALSNVTFYLWNSTDAIANQTAQSLSGTADGANITVAMPYNDEFKWNYLACDSSGNCAFDSNNYTINYDSTSPRINFTDPTELNNSALARNNILINVTSSDANLANITIMLFNSTSLVNSTTTTSSPNFVNITGLPNGAYTFNATAYDTLNNKNTTETRNITISVSTPNTAPAIVAVTPISATNPTEDSFTSIQFNFTAYDADGATDLKTAGPANFTRSGEATRQNATCTQLNTFATNYANYSCTIDMWYFDGAGAWNIGVSLNDTSNEMAHNTTATFTYNELSAFVSSPSALTWGAITPGLTNQSSNNDPLVLNNTGNKNIGTIQVNATNLRGEADNTKAIWAGNFSMAIVTGASLECGITTNQSTTLAGSLFSDISNATLTRGNVSLNNGSGQRNLYACIRLIGSELTQQSYSTSNEGSWTIRILVIGLAFGTGNRKRRKIKNDKLVKAIGLITEELQIKYTLSKQETVKILVEELQEKYNLDNESTAEVVNKQPGVPISIFATELGFLEALSKYLHEKRNMKYSDIARVTLRDERTIWTACRKAQDKQKVPFVISRSSPTVPFEIFANKDCTILESLLIYLRKQEMTYSEIASLLKRDQRNMRTVYMRAISKTEKSATKTN